MGQPLVSMLIFTLLFGRVAKLSVTTAVPYPVFVLAGLLIWNFVAGAISHVGNSLLGASYLISKVYFPRLVVPLSNVVTNLVDFGVAALLLVPVMLWYRVMPGAAILLAPLVVAAGDAVALGVGLWIAALNIEYRDIRIVIPWILQIAMYVTPVVYPLSALPERYRLVATLNPMSGIVEGFRATLFGTPVPAAPLALVGGGVAAPRVQRACSTSGAWSGGSPTSSNGSRASRSSTSPSATASARDPRAIATLRDRLAGVFRRAAHGGRDGARGRCAT